MMEWEPMNDVLSSSEEAAAAETETATATMDSFRQYDGK